jgi:hypothetical protein
MALIARRPMQLNGHDVQPGQAVDGLWPELRERTRRALLSTRRVVQDEGDAVMAGDAAPVAPAIGTAVSEAPPAIPAKRKRGRPRKHPLPEASNG